MLKDVRLFGLTPTSPVGPSETCSLNSLSIYLDFHEEGVEKEPLHLVESQSAGWKEDVGAPNGWDEANHPELHVSRFSLRSHGHLNALFLPVDGALRVPPCQRAVQYFFALSWDGF